MIPGIDDTHDPSRESWVDSANGHPVFPIQNLPFGVFSTNAAERPRGGVAIGDHILDMHAALDADLFTGDALEAAFTASQATLNGLMALGPAPRRALRLALMGLLSADGASAAKARKLPQLLHKQTDCILHLPAAIGAYTDFYAGIQHAINGGIRRNPAKPLNDNYKHLPVAYHSRASSVVVSGTPVRRPNGQMQLEPGAAPIYGPCRKLDLELELGMWVGPGNNLGDPIDIDNAADHLVGLCMLNDWSARDIQIWETLPLGPFNAKNFSTTISPWIVTAEALAPFRQAQRPRPAGDPKPLPYLWSDEDQARGAFDIDIEALIRTPTMRERNMPAHRMALSNLNHLYWTPAQMIAHHTVGGCNLRPGDIFGSGTISGPTPESYGSMRELSDNEKTPQTLPTGERRIFAEDDDDIILRARASRDGYATIGFGDCAGRVLPAHPMRG